MGDNLEELAVSVALNQMYGWSELAKGVKVDPASPTGLSWGGVPVDSRGVLPGSSFEARLVAALRLHHHGSYATCGELFCHPLYGKWAEEDRETGALSSQWADEVIRAQDFRLDVGRRGVGPGGPQKWSARGDVEFSWLEKAAMDWATAKLDG